MKSRTKQQSSAQVAATSTKNLSTAVTAAVSCDSYGKHYPSISAAYWLPAPNTTPYLLPG